MKPCCETLCYIGESHLAGRLIGECETCGARRHGFRCNWLLKRDKNDATKLVLIYRPTAEEKEAKKFRRRTRQAATRIDHTDIPEIVFRDKRALMAQLRQLGFHIKT